MKGNAGKRLEMTKSRTNDQLINELKCTFFVYMFYGVIIDDNNKQQMFTKEWNKSHTILLNQTWSQSQCCKKAVLDSTKRINTDNYKIQWFLLLFFFHRKQSTVLFYIRFLCDFWTARRFHEITSRLLDSICTGKSLK